jgi:hypothetical protein
MELYESVFNGTFFLIKNGGRVQTFACDISKTGGTAFSPEKVSADTASV